MLKKKIKVKLRPLKVGAVVENQKLNQQGMMVKQGYTEGYYHVLSSGKLLEWHMSNMIILLTNSKEVND